MKRFVAVAVVAFGLSGCAWWTENKETVLTLSPAVCAQIARQNNRDDLVPLCHHGGDLARLVDKILTEPPVCPVPEVSGDAGAE